MDIQHLLEKSCQGHSHLCPRQILGVRMGLYALSLLNLEPNHKNKRIFVISETDGCFVDGISTAINCTVGHRSLRVEDYGKAAATFIDTDTQRAVRIAPALNIRQRAYDYAPEESRHYFAQMKAYQIMPAEEMFTAQNVALNISLAQILSRPGVRINCDVCGEEIMNEREIVQNGLTLCQPCARGGYYSTETLSYAVASRNYQSVSLFDS
jgi:formylmethanofuran dehydrogenase subunit E